MSERRYKHPQVNLRLPDELKNRVVELAEANGRSANAEMVAAIESWVDKHKNLQPLDLTTLSQRLAILEKEVALLKKGNDNES